jgi:uncharacterized protein YraI
MRLIRGIALLLAVIGFAGAAEARPGTTTTDLALRAGPSANTEVILTMPAGAKVSVGDCTRGWCEVSFNSTSGYARASGLAIARARASRSVAANGGYIPVYPRYPYRSGHYPKADWYYQLPPYAAIDPSFYRRRFFMMAQERNRYRYMPHIFYGYGDGERIEEIDVQGISSALRGAYED